LPVERATQSFALTAERRSIRNAAVDASSIAAIGAATKPVERAILRFQRLPAGVAPQSHDQLKIATQFQRPARPLLVTKPQPFQSNCLDMACGAGRVSGVPISPPSSATPSLANCEEAVHEDRYQPSATKKLRARTGILRAELKHSGAMLHSVPWNIHDQFARIKPAGIYHFHDKIVLWVTKPISEKERARIESKCLGCVVLRGNGERYRTRQGWRRAWYPNRSYKQRLELFQPMAEGLELIAAFKEPRLSYVEEAHDWTFNKPCQLDTAEELVRLYSVKKYHRDQGIRWFKRTRYSGPRSAPTNLVIYSDKHCKVTGELHCLHFDFRMRGAATLRRAGITSIFDLLALDYDKFWGKRLLFYQLDLGRFGRLYHNHHKASNRRHRWVIDYDYGGLSYDVDRERGRLIFRNCGSVQEVIDKYRKQIDVRSCLIPITVDHLVTATPATSSFDISKHFPNYAPIQLQVK
jgi:hypothetical protein